MSIDADGYAIRPTRLTPDRIEALRASIFVEGEAGTRCLLDEERVRDTAIALRAELVEGGHLSGGAVAIQAIAFDKTAATNWKVTWHQDLMFPFAVAPSSAGFDLHSRKEGVDYARPPVAVLEQMMAVRLHLDDCDESNGPLRVAPGSHCRGVVKSAEIADCVARHGDVACLAREGEVVLMRPLTLHASSRASVPKHRRVLHLVYYSGGPISEPWHRCV